MFSSKNVSSSHRSSHNLSEIAKKSGFKFRDIENRQLDWKALGCVDVNRVVEHQDYDFLQKIIPRIIEAPMQTILSSAVIDPAVSSLFRLAQLSLQYLSFCQQFMDYTLYDLRTAFNHLQRKNTRLRSNYKQLEEEHYKTQEKVQLMQCQSKHSSLVGSEEMMASTSTPFACEYCTKNFLTEELLKAHNIRKHSGKECPEQKQEKLQTESKQLKEKMNAAEKGISQSNSNNNDLEVLKTSKSTMRATDTVCSICSKNSETVVSSVAVQCENDKTMEITAPTPNIGATENHDKANDTPDESKVTFVLAKMHEQTIAELKAEVSELQTALRKKFIEEQVANERETMECNNSAGDKIDVIQERFTAFETMYMQSQHEFIESFRNLDERQRNYMNGIQDTIKEIVEKSLERYDAAAPVTVITADQVHGNCTNDTIEIVQAQLTETIVENGSKTQLRDEDDDDHDHDESNESLSSGDGKSANNKTLELPKSSERRPNKTDAVNEFENRLQQIGVDTKMSGLTTTHSAEVARELADERAEIKKAHRTFASTRNKLNCEVERIAKAKLTSASSVTSLSSHRSDDDVTSQDSGHTKRQKNMRPKTGKRDSSNVLRKFVSDDIDESDLIGKMKMAQKAIDAHRECIQELLQTTAHSPKTMAPASASTSKHSINTAKDPPQDGELNRYSKMPNVTTRRVVFVNLDEDS